MKYIGGSVKIQPSQKDSRLLHATAGPYERMINAAHKMDVIIWDTTTRRGWLVGGDDALLYLSRAAISHHEGQDPQVDQEGRYPKDRFKHVDASNKALATSKDVLLHRDNRKIVIYESEDEPSKPWRFEDEVKAIFEVLHEIRSHRAKLRSCDTQQYDLRRPFTKRFIGIGCLDIISNEPGMRSRCRELKDSAAQWLKLANAVDTVNIIGAGIDTLMMSSLKQPGVALEPPCGHDILTASAKRLDRIAQRCGNIEADCVELAPEVFWCDPHGAFHSNPCTCEAEGAESCCGERVVELRDRRQTFLKGTRGKRMSLASIVERYPTAAVSFGSTSSLPRVI